MHGGRRTPRTSNMHQTPCPVTYAGMERPDLNLLIALDVLLAEGTVVGAARRLGLSPSAMSRTLARLREATGDPLLVRAGRELVPSPRAIELRERLGKLVQGGLRRDLRARAPRPGADRGPSRHAALRSEARQRQRSPARGHGRPGDGRGRQTLRARAARPGSVSGPLRRRRARGAPVERGRGDRRPVRRVRACRRVPQRRRPGAGRARPGVRGRHAEDLRRRRWFFAGAGPGEGLRPGRHGARSAHTGYGRTERITSATSSGWNTCR